MVFKVDWDTSLGCAYLKRHANLILLANHVEIAGLRRWERPALKQTLGTTSTRKPTWIHHFKAKRGNGVRSVRDRLQLSRVRIRAFDALFYAFSRSLIAGPGEGTCVA